jgi:hypothetical protein
MFRITDEDSPVFVELITDGLVRKLALPPHEERALVVGSTAGAALQVTGLGVAPVQFHLERHQRAVWLVPAYKIGDLRLNGTAVDAAAPLEEHNVITFARVRLEVTIRDAETFVTGEASPLDDQRGNWQFGPSYSATLPGEADTTQVAMPPLAPSSSPEDKWPARATQPVSREADNTGGHATASTSSVGPSSNMRPEQVTQRLFLHQPARQADDAAPEFTLSGTQIIPPYRPPPDSLTDNSGVSQGASSPRALEPNPSPKDRPVVDSVQLVPLRNAPRPQAVPPRPAPKKLAQARAVDITNDREKAVAPPPLGRHPLLLSTSDDVRPLPLDKPATGKAAKTAPPLSLLARLGILTRERPLLVGCATGVGAALLVILLLAATRLTAPRADHSTAQRAPALVAELNSLRPATLAPTPASGPIPAPGPSAKIEVSKTHAPAGPLVSVRPGQASGVRRPLVESSRSKALY